MKQGYDPDRRQAGGHYLDLVAYWQEQHSHMQQECDKLRSINIKLERSNQLLATQASNMNHSDPTGRGSKRKSLSTLPTKTAKRTKATSRKKSAEQLISDAQDVIESDSNFLHTLGVGKTSLYSALASAHHTCLDGAKLTDHLFTIHSLCRAINVDAEMLCLNLVQTISVLGKVVRFVSQHHEQLSNGRQRSLETTPSKSDKSDFATSLSICARAFMSVLVGTQRLSECCTGGKLSGRVISELAEMFKSALFSIELLAKQTAQMHATQSHPPKKGKSKGAVNSATDSMPTYSISHLLNSFLGLLNKTDGIHQKIFDAFLFVLLERVGRRLYYCTFGRNRTNSTQDSIMPIQQLRNGGNQVSERIVETTAVKLEVKALVLILERALGLAPNHMNPQSGRPKQDASHLSRTLSFRNLPTASKARLSPPAKDRLQRTLIACMYGGAANSSDEFLDILTKPMPPMREITTQSVVKIKDEDVESWYMQEIWRLVGWDILARESGW